MKIRVNDEVIVLAGKDKGKTGGRFNIELPIHVSNVKKIEKDTKKAKKD